MALRTYALIDVRKRTEEKIFVVKLLVLHSQSTATYTFVYNTSTYLRIKAKNIMELSSTELYFLYLIGNKTYNIFESPIYCTCEEKLNYPF